MIPSFTRTVVESLRDRWDGLHARTRLRLLFGTGLVLGLYAAVLIGSTFTRAIIEDKLEARTGLIVEMGRPSFGLTSIRLRDVHLCLNASRGLRVGVRSATLHTGFLGWLRGRPSAVNRVELSGLAVIANADDPTLRAFVRDLSRTARAQASASPKDESAGRRSLAADDLRVEIWEGKRPLIRVWNGEASYLASEAHVRFGRGHLVTRLGDEVKLQELEARARRSRDGLRLEHASLGRVHAMLARRMGEVPDPKPAQKTATQSRPQTAPVPKSAPGTARSQAAPAVLASSDPLGQTLSHWLITRLAPSARIELFHADVYTATTQKPELLLGQAAITVEKKDHQIHTKGTGKTAHDGSMSWDLHLEPASLRAEGNVRFRAISLALVAPFLVRVPWYEPEKSRLEGELVIRSQKSPSGASELTFQGSVAVQNASISAARIAPQPIRNISAKFNGLGKWMPARHRVEVYQAAVELQNARASLKGAMEWAPDHYLMQLQSNMPSTPCQAVVDAIPRDMLGEFAGFQLQGLMAGELRLDVDSRRLDDSVLDVQVSDACEFVGVPGAADVSRFARPFVHQVTEPDGRVFQMETGPTTPLWTPLGSVTMFLVHAILAHEDGGFWGHHGFYVRSIRDAMVVNLKAKRYRKGASTITMQTVKNLFLKREKTLARKMQEAVLTWMIEHMLRKSDILELYLNVIEYGPGVYGIRQAARYYFNTTPDRLTPAQSVYIATMLPNPKLYSGSSRRGVLSETWSLRIRRILEKMYMRGQINKQALDFGVAELGQFGFHGEAPRPNLPMGEPATLASPFEPQTLPETEGAESEWESNP